MEAIPDEEPSVLISAKALRILVDDANDAPPKKGIDQDAAIEEAESALERYPVIPHTLKEQA